MFPDIYSPYRFINVASNVFDAHKTHESRISIGRKEVKRGRKEWKRVKEWTDRGERIYIYFLFSLAG